MSTKMIKIEGIKKSFNSVDVLKGVNFEVEKGSVFALLGSNGAGKTTMIRIMATLIKADAGKCIINGFDLEINPQEIRKSVSLNGQFTALDDILTGRENLIMIAKLRHLSHPFEAAEEMIKRFGMSEAADRRVGTYSGGMKRRIDIAMSLLGNPSIIFLDEPTAGLDPEARLEVWSIIRELSQAGTTIFLTTQYLEEAEKLANRIAILHGGRIIAEDTLEGLKKLLPPAKLEYIEKQPSLEEIFLAVTTNKEEKEMSL